MRASFLSADGRMGVQERGASFVFVALSVRVRSASRHENVSRYNRGVRRPYRPRLNSEEKRERNKRLLADHARGDSMLLIANRYDITPDHVRRIIKASSRQAEQSDVRAR